jgi:tRNA (guanine26-N2/guanine27-N2)-dimethyltransferase
MYILRLPKIDQVYPEEKRLNMCAGKRLLCACYLNEEFFDLIDLDAFGSDTTTIGPALDALRFGGLLYITSTDAFSISGKRPARSLASYGAFSQLHPFHAEQGLRILTGAALREAATRGLVVEPLFSIYSPHGPVYRVMLRVKRCKEVQEEVYGFVGYSRKDGSIIPYPFKYARNYLYVDPWILRR